MPAPQKTLNPKIALFGLAAQKNELDRLAELLGDIHAENGEISPEWLVHYIGCRREQLHNCMLKIKRDLAPAVTQ
jgi:hypothetical protein